MARWIILVVLIAALYGVQAKLFNVDTEGEHVEVAKPSDIRPAVKDATFTPGRVVQLTTEAGNIEFVLFEKDCPVTAKRIADLVTSGAYNGVKIPRVEKGVIQTAPATKTVPPITIEPCTGLNNTPGAVGMARKKAYDTNVSSFYIMKESWPHLNQQYTVFGYVVKGMDVVNKTKLDTIIKSAKLRPLTPQDTAVLKKAKLQKP